MTPRSGRHLAATLALAGLALAGANLDLPTTGALYTASTSTTLEGFQVQPLCEFESYESVPDLLADLTPTLHWGFDPGADDEGWAAAGDPLPAAAAPDGTLLCDDGVIALAAGQSASSGVPLTSPMTTILVLGTPSSAGVVLSLLAAGGGVDVVVDGDELTVRAWVDAAAPVTVATGEFDEGLAHVLALTVDGPGLTLWVDGATTAGALPLELAGAVGGAGLGVGALTTFDEPDDVATAQFTATELAVVGGVLAPAELEAIHEAAVPGP